jgi:hypothetical protein
LGISERGLESRLWEMLRKLELMYLDPRPATRGERRSVVRARHFVTDVPGH